jgi:hypothetical protein
MSNIQASTLPVGPCVQMSFWQQSGGIWKPIVPTSFKRCTAILRFLNGAEHFIVQTPDDNVEFDRLTGTFLHDGQRQGLTSDEKAALEQAFPGAVQTVDGESPPMFALPMVAFGNDGIDITTRDVSVSQQLPKGTA